MPNLPELSLTDQWLGQLKSSGYRLTSPLRIIVDILANSSRAMSPIDLFDLGRKEYPNLGLVTVYRSIDKLEELGLVQRVHQAGGCHRYMRAARGHEHILLCTRCGRVRYFSGDDLTELIDTTAQKSGYSIQEHWLQLYGLCAKCQS
jgi:Fur family ferric uptake transcriptional regulator